MFLTDDEIRKLTGYEPNQRKRICRWLREHGYPFEINRLGDPVVLRKDVESVNDTGSQPNFDFLEAS